MSIIAPFRTLSKRLARRSCFSVGQPTFDPLPAVKHTSSESLSFYVHSLLKIRFYADLAEKLGNEQPEEVPVSDDSFKTRVVREPLGVIGAITPWNYPLLMAVQKVAPALAAGCSIVL